MDPQIVDKIHVTVTDILNSSDIDSLTEQQVRHLASQILNIDLSHLSYKILIRQIIEAFLLSTPPQNAAVSSPFDEHEQKPLIKPEVSRIICKLSEKREVSVRSNGGKTIVAIGELPEKDGKANANATSKWAQGARDN